MSASVQLGLLLAIGTAFASVVSFFYKQRGAVESRAVDWRTPVRSSLMLFGSRWYSLGIAIALSSWFLHVAALALAPISLVQSVIAGGLVLVTVTADRLFGFRVTRREWIGVGLAALGLAFLAATIGSTGDEARSGYSTPVLVGWIAALSALSTAVAVAARGTPRAGVLYGAAAGLLWAASDTSIKALSDHLGEGMVAVLVSPLAAVILIASLVGLLVSARSFQLGDVVPVIAVTSVTANTFTIAAGPIVFSEPLPSEPLGLVVRLLAFAMVIVAAALTPAPVPAADRTA